MFTWIWLCILVQQCSLCQSCSRYTSLNGLSQLGTLGVLNNKKNIVGASGGTYTHSYVELLCLSSIENIIGKIAIDFNTTAYFCNTSNVNFVKKASKVSARKKYSSTDKIFRLLTVKVSVSMELTNNAATVSP